MTKDKAIELMKSHGYEMVSEAGNDSWVGFVKNIQNIRMTAKVMLVPESVTLSGGILKMACELTCRKFDVNSNKFDAFENVLYLYAKICSQIDNLIDAEGIVEKAFTEAASTIKPEPEITKNNLEERKEKFKDEVKAIGKKRGYPSEMCKKFFNYWSETNSGGKKMRWEIQKQKSGVFNTQGRMVTWFSKDKEDTFTKDREERKALKQNEQLKKTPTTINTKELF